MKTPLSLLILLITIIGNSQGFNKSNNNSSSINLMPVPKILEKTGGAFRITKYLRISSDKKNNSERINNAILSFIKRLDRRTGAFFDYDQLFDLQQEDNPCIIEISFNESPELEMKIDESYSLDISSEKILLEAQTDIGAIRGLETLLQLVESNNGTYYFPGITIQDSPRFPWRGLLIDVARNFQPIHLIKRNIQAMASVKLNVLHLHLCDDHGWRVESHLFPKLHEEASEGNYYTQEEIRDLVKFADLHGIRVVPEIDIPGHATSILTAYPQYASIEMDYKLKNAAGIFDAVLDPTKEATYTFLDSLLTEVCSLFPDEYFHIGGDENNGVHWEMSKDVRAFGKTFEHYIEYNPDTIPKKELKKLRHHNTSIIQGHFNSRIFKLLDRLGKSYMGWEEILVPELRKDAVIHAWKGGETLEKAIVKGYNAVLSKGYYIDLMFSSENHYLQDPTNGLDNYDKTITDRILGGEATMWSEYTTPEIIESRMWPRCAAIAERFWSPKSVTDVADMYRRLNVVSRQLEDFGLNHITYRERLVRNLASGHDSYSLEVLLRVVEPFKNYTRNWGDCWFTLDNPYSMPVDAANADAMDAYYFNSLLKTYQKNKTDEVKVQLLTYIASWKENDTKFQDLVKKSPILKNISSVSTDLKTVASICESAIEGVSSEELKNMKDQLNSLKMTYKTRKFFKCNDETKDKLDYEGGKLEIMILEPVIKFLDTM